jgi:hypothetical protein
MTNLSSSRTRGPVKKKASGLGTNKNMVMSLDRARNQEWLYWRAPAVICSTDQLKEPARKNYSHRSRGYPKPRLSPLTKSSSNLPDPRAPNLNEIISPERRLHFQNTEISYVSGLKCHHESQRNQLPRRTPFVKANGRTLLCTANDNNHDDRRCDVCRDVWKPSTILHGLFPNCKAVN